MSQFLRNLQFVTQSFTGTPNTGTGVMFASESKLYFENASGSVFPLGGPGYLIVREYTGSDAGGGTLTYTWNTPVNLKHLEVICIGGGGGGGGGRCSTSGRVTGGTGGGGGAMARGFFDRKDLTQSSYTISVGGGGAGGAPSAVNVIANSGVSGRYTTFGGTLVSASGGGGGLSGAVSTGRAGGVGGLSTACRPGASFAIPGGTGGTVNAAGAAATPSNFFATPLTPISTAGGGAGGGYDSLTGPTAYSGSKGASGVQWNTTQTNGGDFGKPATAGTDNLVTAAVLLHFTSSAPFSTTYGLGGGGSGGDVNITQLAGYNGSNGGKFGAGGGGGGGTTTVAGSPTSGGGGSGSSGLCILLEYY